MIFFFCSRVSRYPGTDGSTKPWECVGHVVRIQNEEVALELRSNAGCPIDISRGYCVDFVWKSTSFDRMQVCCCDNEDFYYDF